ASGSSSSKSTSGNIPLSASHRPIFVSIPVIANSLPTRPPRSTTSRAFRPESPASVGAERSASSASLLAGDESANVLGERAPDLSVSAMVLSESKLGALRSIVSLRRLELPAWPTALAPLESFLRCDRAGLAALGTLVEVVNDGGEGIAPSRVFGCTGSLSTALGGW